MHTYNRPHITKLHNRSILLYPYIIINHYYYTILIFLALSTRRIFCSSGAQGPHLRDECEGPGAAQAAQEPWPVSHVLDPTPKIEHPPNGPHKM